MDSSQCPLSKLVAPLFVGTNNQSIGNGGSKKEGRHPIAYQRMFTGETAREETKRDPTYMQRNTEGPRDDG